MEQKRYNRTKLILSFISTLLFVFYILFSTFFSNISANISTFSHTFFTAPVLIFFIFILFWGGIFKAFSLPLDFYSEFILEKKYDLSNQTVLSWIKESLKGVVVSTVIGLPLLGVFYYILLNHPAEWWLIAGLLFFLFSILLSNIAPVIIFPLFYKFTPIENVELYNRLKKMAEDNGLKIKDVLSFNMSKNTKKANAALAGLGNTRRIILSDTLIETMDDNEICAVFAHELGHYKLKHMVKMIFMGAVNIFAGLYFVALGLNYVLSITGDRFNGIADPAIFPLITLFLMVFGIVLKPLNNWISRKHEISADRYAVDVVGSSNALISGLEKISKQNKSDPEPNIFIEWFLYSHPPLKKRVEYLLGASKKSN